MDKMGRTMNDRASASMRQETLEIYRDLTFIIPFVGVLVIFVKNVHHRLRLWLVHMMIFWWSVKSFYC